jgi:hypothetical protein
MHETRFGLGDKPVAIQLTDHGWRPTLPQTIRRISLGCTTPAVYFLGPLNERFAEADLFMTIGQARAECLARNSAAGIVDPLAPPPTSIDTLLETMR